ncbi:YggT family protein [Thiothrix caldifontis]|uniref:YggT family protein n=1 Tax=Thiothrix caldifontis TaxID=525918 RepID=A0A1H3WHM3_9GAMM|nr:YggT family protein [Thiothrix caldifontis]SDZ85832.1 YggT family protein [Thiothrix caldifontis]
MEALQNIGIFLTEVLFSFYIGAILIRFLLALSRANFYNPLSQSLVKITNPALVPLRRMVPAIGKLDTAAIVLALGLKIIQTLLLVALQGSEVSLPVVFVYAVIDLLRTVIYIYLFALVIQAVLSWVGNSHGNPLTDILHSLTEPLLRPVRQFVPVMGMIDFAPMVAILLLYIVLIILQSFGL